MGGKVKITDDDLNLICSSLRYRMDKLREEVKRSPHNEDVINETTQRLRTLLHKIIEARRSQS